MKLSHWYGRLGNNIQQVANGLMSAQAYKTRFENNLEHDIIQKFSCSFGDNVVDASGKFFYWDGPYKEVPIDRGVCYTQMRSFCKTYVRPRLQLPRVDVDPDTLVMHLRSGDVFDQRVTNPDQYVPNRFCFYDTLLEQFDKCILVTEDTTHNPIVKELAWNPKVTVQSKTVEEDFATLLNAKHLATSGVGTFAMAAALCSNTVENIYCTNLHIMEHLNYQMLYNTDITINMMVLDNYIKPGEWTNSDEQRELLFSYKA